MSLRALNLISILSAMMIGAWLPLRLVPLNLPAQFDTWIDLLISGASFINIYLYFQAHQVPWKKLSSWRSPSLLMDVCCLIPFSAIEIFVFQSEHRLLLLVNCLAIRHVIKIKTFLDEFDGLPPVLHRLVPIGMMMPLLVHGVACIWIFLGSGNIGPNDDKVVEYVKAIYWAFTTLTTVGYGDITASTIPQMLYVCFVQLTGVGVFGFVLSNVASLLSRMDAAREHHLDNLDKIETFMQSHHIPVDIKGRVRSYYHYMWKKHRGYQDHTLLEDLPVKIQSELLLFINRNIVSKVPLFKGASEELVEELMSQLSHRVYLPGEKIFHAGDHGDALYFIQSGQVSILTADNKLLATLHDGAFFGEVALISDSARNATAQAATYCDMYFLTKDSFHHVLNLHPDFKAHVEEVAQLRQNTAA
jgi:succinate dehydrogenase/fumarate reductase cytochrome b subunit